jgi:hypothetical protein
MDIVASIMDVCKSNLAARQVRPCTLFRHRDGETVDGDFIAAEAARDDAGARLNLSEAGTERIKSEDARGPSRRVATKHFAPPLSWFWRAQR